MAAGTGNLTTYGMNGLLNGTLTLGGATLYAALFTADPGVSGSTTSELSGGGYARIPITLQTSTVGKAVTAADQDFAPWTGSTTTVASVGIMTSSTAGNMVGRMAVTETLTTGQNDYITLKAGFGVDLSVYNA